MTRLIFAFIIGIFAFSAVSVPVFAQDSPTVVVDRFPATVYRNPNEDSFVVGIAPTNLTMPVIGMTSDGAWWQVTTDLGVGFVRAVEVAFRGDANVVPRVADPGPSFDGPTIRVNVDTAVVSQPGGGDVIANLPAGTALPASGRTTDNAWWQVADVFGVGWIPVTNVSLAGAASSIRSSSNTTFPGPGFTGEAFATVVIEAERKIAYNAPSFASAAMWDTRLGEESGVIGRTADGLWLQITREGRIGWVHFSGVTLRGSMEGIPVIASVSVSRGGGGIYTGPNIVIVNTHWLNVRSGPGVKYARVGAAPGGATLPVTGRHPVQPWLRVEGDFGVGWVRVLYTIFRGDWDSVPIVEEPVGEIELPVTVVVSPVDIYSQPSLVYPAGSLAPGTYMIIGRTADYTWALLATPQGNVWLPYGQLILRGVEESIPVVQGQIQ